MNNVLAAQNSVIVKRMYMFVRGDNMAVVGIVAGGTGSRMGADRPKQMLDLCGKPVLIRTAEAFAGHKQIEHIIIGIHADWYDEVKELAEKYFGSAVTVTKGGSDRNETVQRIIETAKGFPDVNDDTIILTHDAVRPFVTEKMIDDSIEAMEKYAICTAAVSATDTIVVSKDGSTVSDFPIRSTMFQVQTPQTFRIGRFSEVYNGLSDKEREQITDVCKLFYRKGYEVGLVEGDRKNIKLTYASDMAFAEKLFIS